MVLEGKSQSGLQVADCSIDELQRHYMLGSPTVRQRVHVVIRPSVYQSVRLSLLCYVVMLHGYLTHLNVI